MNISLYTAHLHYSAPGQLTRKLAMNGKPVEFVRFLTRDEQIGREGKNIMVRDAEGFRWEVSSKDLTVTEPCQCGCNN